MEGSSSCLGSKLIQTVERHGVRCWSAQRLPTCFPNSPYQLPQRTVKTSRCGALWFLTGKARQARLAATLRFMKGSEMSLLDRDASLFWSWLIFEQHCPEQGQEAGNFPTPRRTAVGLWQGTFLLNGLMEKNYLLHLERSRKTHSHAVASNQGTTT